MNRLCNVGIQCALFPGEVDSPVVNFSSEAADPLLFRGVYYPPTDPGCLGCDPVPIYHSQNCFGTVFSATSQAEANLLARSSGAICKEPTAQQFTNEAQTASCQCPGGSTFSYTTPAGFMAIANDPDPEAWIAAANAAALAYAQQQVAILEQRSCASTTSLLPHPGWMCFGEELLDGSTNIYTITGLNAAGDWDFLVVGGALPPGVTLDKTSHNTAQLSGTPAAPGVYTYTILAVRPVAPTTTVSTTDTLAVFGITNPSLPNATVGTAYSEQILTSGGVDPVTFTLVGTLPSGLTLHTDGTIDGTPTSAGPGSFEVRFSDSAGKVCTETVTITVLIAGCISPETLPPVIYGTPYNVQLITPTYLASSHWSFSGFPPSGVVIDEDTGLLTVGGLECGTYPIVVRFRSDPVDWSSNPVIDCTKNYSLVVTPMVGFDCGGVPTTAPSGIGWVWPGGDTPLGGGPHFGSFSVCNNTCNAKLLTIHFTADHPWSTVDSGQLFLGGFPVFYPPFNVTDHFFYVTVLQYSTFSSYYYWETASGTVEPNSGNITFSF